MIGEPCNSLEYKRELERLKTGARAFTMNCFARTMQIEEWAERGQLSFIRTPGASLVLRLGRGVTHLSHIATDHNSLSVALSLLDSMKVADQIVADLVGQPQEVQQIAKIYSACGFKSYKQLVRMTRTLTSDHKAGLPEMGVRCAKRSEARDVLEFLDSLLDPLSEQIPELENLEAAAERGEIIVEANARAIAGILIFEAVGFSITIRYWFIDPKAHGRGVGGRLMRSFLLRVAGKRRLALWAFSNNADAIAKYEHYGFRRDGLIDWIMLRPI